MEKIRVLQIIRAMGFGGAETFIMNVYRNIDRDKVQFDFLVSDNGNYDEEIKRLGGKIYKIPYLTEVGQVKYGKELKKFFSKHPEYKTVHSHIDQVSGIIVETAKKCGVKNIISHSHNTRNSNNIVAKIYKKYLQSKINKNTTVKLACGEQAAKWLYTKESDKAIVINNGINIEKFRFDKKTRVELRKELDVSDDTTVIGHVGRFCKQKNHEFLVDIFNEYQKTHDAVLLLIGDGELKQTIIDKVESFKLQNKVKFLGLRTDVYRLYSVMDIVLLPSLYEGLSVTAIEAQCNGLKVLTSNTIDVNTDVTGNVIFEDLNNSSEVWSERLSNIDMKREDINDIRLNEYDITKVANKMQEIYLSGEKCENIFSNR